MAVVSTTGTQFRIGDGATPTEIFTALAQVQEVKPSGWARKTIDQYTLDSLYPERLIGAHEPQNVEVKLLFDGAIAAHEAFRTRLVAGTLHNFQIVMSDAGAYQIQFRGFVTKFVLDPFSAEGEAVIATVTIELTTLPTVTP